MPEIMDSPEDKSPPPPRKQPYEKMELIIYGDIVALTCAASTGGNNDGGMVSGQMSTSL